MTNVVSRRLVDKANASKKGGSKPAPNPTPATTPAALDPTQDLNKMVNDMIAAIQQQQQVAQQEQQRIQAEYQQQIARAEGTTALNSIFSERLTAANTAISEVEAQLRDEKAHAASRGMDYNVTPEDKQARINASFSNYWTEGKDAQFNELQTKWGSDTTKWVLPVARTGATATSTAATERATALKAPTVVGAKVDQGTVLTSDDEEPASTLLGGS